MKYRVLFSLNNIEKIFMTVVSIVVIGTLRVECKPLSGGVSWPKKANRKSLKRPA